MLLIKLKKNLAFDFFLISMFDSYLLEHMVKKHVTETLKYVIELVF